MNYLRLYLFVSACLVVASTGWSDARFERFDKNKDGKLSKSELPSPLRRNFDRVDKNQDGAISLEEHLAVNKARVETGRHTLGGKGVQLMSDISYAGNNNVRQQLDLMIPTTRKREKLPVVVFIHGGAWRAGNKNGGRNKLMPFVSSGQYAGVSVGYRLSGEAIWPAQIHDCKAAIRWIRAHADEYKLDADRIGIWGSSAGGHLVNMLGVSGGVKALEGRVGPHIQENSRVNCVVNFFGPTELLSMNAGGSTMDHDAPDSPESQLIGGPIQERVEAARAASPLSYVTKDDAPFLHVHGTKDPLVPFQQAKLFHAALEAAGVSSVLYPVEGAGHGFNDPAVDKRVQDFLATQLLQ